MAVGGWKKRGGRGRGLNAFFPETLDVKQGKGRRGIGESLTSTVAYNTACEL